jgi:hypothetical protein
MIRAEIESPALLYSARDGIEERGLEDSVLVMTLFRPRIGKKDPNFAKSGVFGQRVEEFSGIGVDEVTVLQLPAGGLFTAPGDALGINIDAYAAFFGKFGRETR